MGSSIAHKILVKKSGNKPIDEGDVIYAEPDLVLLYDWPGFDGFMRNIRINPDKIVLNIDHFFLPNTELAAKTHRNYRETAKKYGIKHFYDIGNNGIGFHLAAEKGHIKPGMLIVHADPHVSTFGAFGAYCVGVGGDLMSAFLMDEVWLRVPQVIKVNLSGNFAAGVTSRDLFEHILADLGPDGAVGQVLEFTGPALAAMSMDSRMGLCSSMQYLSAETAIINPDETTYQYVRSRTEEPFEAVLSDPDAAYARVLNYDVSGLEPMVVTPPDVYYVKRVGEVAGIDIDQAFIGTCANGRLDDLRLAARILKGRKVHPRVRFLVTPVTQQTMLDAVKEGIIDTFLQAGVLVGPPTCGPCYGGFGYLLPGETCLSTGTLNIPGRMGSTEAKIYMANPATVAASAIEGKITDPRKYF
ncbi:MAG: 3-isopropylmalate dehydratase large subunit [Chloroflexi bacterium]|nr:3-isopropylmalate dehydratase large subunit [Chloroflexota bacterium]